MWTAGLRHRRQPGDPLRQRQPPGLLGGIPHPAILPLDCARGAQLCVPLVTVVETMRQTGIDTSHEYRESSGGGLAVDVIEC